MASNKNQFLYTEEKDALTATSSVPNSSLESSWFSSFDEFNLQKFATKTFITITYKHPDIYCLGVAPDIKQKCHFWLPHVVLCQQ
jgi:hypothetical protein